MDIVHSHGHDPGVLDPRTDRLFVVALSQSPAKVMLRAADAAHLEIALPASGAPDRPTGTRCYMNLERTVVELRERLKPRDCGAAVIDRVNAYISPPGCGAPLHFDIRTVWIVQLFGCKTWRLGDKPAVEQPSHNCVLPNGERHVIYDGRELEAPTRMRTYNLFPGDWLLVPKGVWHETTTTAGSVSATLAAPEGS